MVLIWNKLQEFLDISSDRIWAHLETMYNLEALDEIVSLPFPNDERDFYLPDSEYGSLKAKKWNDKMEEKTVKTSIPKKLEVKEVVKPKEVKKEDKIPNKKDTQRRDSKDSKDGKMSVSASKKEIRKDLDKLKPLKGKTGGIKEEDKNKIPKNEDAKRGGKRPTRGSLKPDEIPAQKSQSPLTVVTVGMKRRRL